MALDIESAIYGAVAGIGSYAAFTALSPAVKLILDTQIAAGVKRAVYRAPADFPQLRVELAGGSRVQNPPRIFGHNATSFTSATCDHVVPATVEVNLIGIYDAPPDLAKQQAVESVVDTFLHSKWPKFGLAWVASFTVRKTRRRETSAITNNVERTVTRWTLTFNARPKLSQLAS